MPNSLTTQAGLKLGPIVIETFFKHYLERKSEASKAIGSESPGHTSLREQDLLWQESFEIIKSFLNQATRHTVEELQEFSNARIPVAPWIYVKSILVPLSSCDAAAAYLIKALGGEELTKRVVGGTKWWQVRGLRGVDCQWIWQKSDMRASRKRQKTRGRHKNSEKPTAHSSVRFSPFRKLSNHLRSSSPETMNYSREGLEGKDQSKSQNDSEGKDTSQESLGGVDGTRCMLYSHGGGYYFGSIDQERYCLQRYARKIKGRVFAVNYRLSPQYPFPCAIQDVLAAYLYLIEPPSGAMHAPIPPSLIVLGGDSAGGGLCLATLQVMRDSGIPLPAGAVLISPWCDLTHSFPSTLSNTETDIIPPYGLCLHKPSVLWPPPPAELSSIVRAGLRERFKAVAKRAVLPSGDPPLPPAITDEAEKNKSVQVFNDLKTDTTKRLSGEGVCRILPKNEAQDPPLEVSDALEGIADILLATDTLNPAANFLPVAGKPPLPWDPSESFDLLVDKKTFTVDTQIQLYCPNNLLAHPLVSPILGYLGGLPPLLVIASDKEVLRDEIVYLAHKAAHPDRFPVNEDAKMLYPPLQNIETPFRSTPVHLQVYDETAHVLPLFSFTTPAKYCYRAIAAFIKHLTPSSESPELYILETPSPQTISPESQTLSNIFFVDHPRSPMSDMPTLNLRRQSSPSELLGVRNHDDSGDVAGSRFKTNEKQPEGPDTAGSPSAYTDIKWPSEDIMIRERVSTRGILRPLEPESGIPTLKLPTDRLGKINEGVARRFLTGQDLWKKKFGNTAKKIEAKRMKHLQLARSETIRTVESLGQLQEHLFGEHDSPEISSHCRKNASTSRRWRGSLRDKADAERNSWIWTWALDGEHPPPTSIVSRRDTAEARALAHVADLSVEQEESKLSGNMLWSVLVNFLTAQPSHKHEEEQVDGDDKNDDTDPRSDDRVGQSRRSRILRRFKSLGDTPSQRGP